MLGKTVLFCPGYDHAGIATQSVVEKRMYKATGQTRHDIGREALLHKIAEWKDECAYTNLCFFPLLNRHLQISSTHNKSDQAPGRVMRLVSRGFYHVACALESCCQHVCDSARRRDHLPLRSARQLLRPAQHDSECSRSRLHGVDRSQAAQCTWLRR